jgi:hypothetical protein
LWKDVPDCKRKRKSNRCWVKYRPIRSGAVIWIILQKINEENVVIVPETWFEGMCSDSFMSDDYRVSFRLTRFGVTEKMRQESRCVR